MVEHVLDAGVVIALEADLSGFAPRRECGFGVGEPLTAHYVEGQPVSVRVVALDSKGERLTLSFLHADGARIMAEEAQLSDSAATLMSELQPEPLAGTDLGALLKQALTPNSDCA